MRKELFERKVKLLLYVGHYGKVERKPSMIAKDLNYVSSQLYEDLDKLRDEGYLKEEGQDLILDEKGREFILPFLVLKRVGRLLWIIVGFTVVYSLFGYVTNVLPLVQSHWGQVSLLTQLATSGLFGALAFILERYPLLLISQNK